jgi:RNA polymerase sigma-70 factor (ECF subfamily)
MRLHQKRSSDRKAHRTEVVDDHLYSRLLAGKSFRSRKRVRALAACSGAEAAFSPAHGGAAQGRKAEREEETLSLLRCVAEGDFTAFWSLWERNQNYLYNVCLRQMGGVHEDAEDALSRVMFKALDKLPGYAGKIANLKAWLTRLTYNLCMDIYRERKRGAIFIESIEELLTADYVVVARSAESPEEIVLHREMCAYLQDTIDKLPARLREPFVLRFFQDMPHRDIGEHLTLSNENVRKRVQQARAILQQGLHNYLSSPGGASLSCPPTGGANRSRLKKFTNRCQESSL